MPLLRWSGVAGVAAVFSGRRGGVSDGAYESLNLGLRSGDDLGRVAENRRRVCAAAAVDPGRTSSCHQFHSAVVHEAVARARPAVRRHVGGLAPRRRPRHAPARAAASSRSGRTACRSCVARTDGTGVGVCHAGWRGLLGGVVEHTVERPRRRRPRGGRRAVRRPRRATRCGADVAGPLRERFGEAALRGPQRRPRGLRRRSRWSAPASAAVDVAGLCTITDAERFFSYRRDGAACGRQAVIAHLEAVDG